MKTILDLLEHNLTIRKEELGEIGNYDYWPGGRQGVVGPGGRGEVCLMSKNHLIDCITFLKSGYNWTPPENTKRSVWITVLQTELNSRT